MTERTDNPLFGANKSRPGKVTREMLDELAAKLNRMSFVVAHGWHYVVGQRFIDGQWKAVLDRNDGKA